MSSKSGALLDRPEPLQTECKHHWIIEPASGPISQGVCKICGAKKQFDNVLEETAIDKYDATAFARLGTKVAKVVDEGDGLEVGTKKKKSAISMN